MLRYHTRAVACTRKVTYARQLAWLARKDEEERLVWVDKFRNSDDTLGKIVYDTMESRCSCWEVSEEAARPPPRPLPGGELPDRGRYVGRGLCANFNTGKCPCTGDCPQGAHRCNMLVGPPDRRRPCNKDHAALDHTRPPAQNRSSGRGKDRDRNRRTSRGERTYAGDWRARVTLTPRLNVRNASKTQAW